MSDEAIRVFDFAPQRLLWDYEDPSDETNPPASDSYAVTDLLPVERRRTFGIDLARASVALVYLVAPAVAVASMLWAVIFDSAVADAVFAASLLAFGLSVKFAQTLEARQDWIVVRRPNLKD